MANMDNRKGFKNPTVYLAVNVLTSFYFFFFIFLIKHACRLGEQRPVRSAELDKDFCIKSCFFRLYLVDLTWGNESFFFLYCDIWIYLHKKTVKKKKNDCYYIVDGH